MRIWQLWAITLVLLATARAGEPKAVIEGPAEAGPGGVTLLDGRKSSADLGQPLRWKLINSDVPFLTFDKDGRKDVFCFLPAAPQGVYRFALIALGKPEGGDLTADVAVHEVQVGIAPTPVPPTPAPTPTPTPVPAATRLHATLIYDVDRADPATASVRTSPALADSLKALNCVWRSYDIRSETVQQRNFGPTVAHLGGPPALILQVEGVAPPLAAVKLPATGDEVSALVSRFRGK